ncbi:hypothetical protein QJ856_gp0139 [Tupanvirus deep ocean]|uniref:Uncharacterized protein n=2 Tax=Tupanvirus TaxID=2094720 RepID=A0AC62AAB4_9VIRU|nr:hypothetical protein QJ856_gp0139 [Tupanvirus deep ocean]QKU34588.1 hypothetical protein [Tupanvirus deep ocean]
MAAAVLFYTQENSERDAIISGMNKENDKNNEKLMHLNNNNKKGVHYGYMWYYEYYYDGLYFNEYKIYDTSDDINKIITGIQNVLIWAVENKKITNFMVYQVEDVDPRLVSYNIIKSSNYPWFKIKINGKSKNICDFFCDPNGNKSLYMQVYPHLNFLNDYNKYVENIESLDNAKLKDTYEQVFNKKASFIFNKRSKILKHLTEQKKFELIETYKK